MTVETLPVLARRRSGQRRQRVRTWLNTLAIAIVAGIFTFPFVWMFLTALKPANEVFSGTPELFGSQVRWQNFPDAWNAVPFGRFIVNGFIVSTLGAALAVLVAIFSAYAFSRLQFRGRDSLFQGYVLTLVLPQEVLVVPLFIMMNEAGLIDTYVALILPFAFTAFGTFLLRQFLLTIPAEYEEAARIDGAGRIRALFSILVPQLVAPLSVLAVFTFVGYWNSYLWPLIVINTRDKATVPLGLGMFTGQYGTQWSLVMAASTMAVIPSLLMVVLLQRQLIKGVSLGGLGGR